MAAFARGDAGDELRAIVEAQLRVTATETAGDALDDELGIWFNEDGHGGLLCSFDRFLSGLGHALGGDEGQAGFSQSLATGIHVVALKAHNER